MDASSNCKLRLYFCTTYHYFFILLFCGFSISLFANIILRSDPNPITSETLPHILDHKIANCQKRPKIELLWPV